MELEECRYVSEFSALLNILSASLPDRREKNCAPLAISEWVKRSSYIRVWVAEMRTGPAMLLTVRSQKKY